MDKYNELQRNNNNRTTHLGIGNGTSRDGGDAGETTNRNSNDDPTGKDSGLTLDRQAERGRPPQSADFPQNHGNLPDDARVSPGNTVRTAPPCTEANEPRGTMTAYEPDQQGVRGSSPPTEGTEEEAEAKQATQSRETPPQGGEMTNFRLPDTVERELDEIQRQLEAHAPTHVLAAFMDQRTIRRRALETRPPTQGGDAESTTELVGRPNEDTAQTEEGDFDWDAPIIPLVSGLPSDLEQRANREHATRGERRPSHRAAENSSNSSGTGTTGDERANPTLTPRNMGDRRKKKKRGALKIATLNIRGGGTANTQEKWKHLNQAIRENTLDIAVIQETHFDEQRKAEIQKLFDARIHIFNCGNQDRPNAEGIAIVLSKATTRWKEARVTNVIRGRAIHMTLPWGDDNELNLLGVYAPNPPGENARFWEELTREIRRKKLNHPDLMLGDFNMVEDSLDRLPPHHDSSSVAEALSDVKAKFHLSDGWRSANPTRLGYTFRMTDIQSRIDRIYVTEKLANQCHQWQISHTAIRTDHKIVSVELVNPGTPYLGKGRYATPVILLENRKLMQRVLSICKEHQETMDRITPETRTIETNAQTVHKSFKERVVQCIRNFAKENMPKYTREIKALEKDLTKTLQEDDPDEERKRVNAAMIDERISQLERLRHTKNRDNVATKAIIESETVGKYWIEQNREKKPRDTIPALRTPANVGGTSGGTDGPPQQSGTDATNLQGLTWGETTTRKSEEMAEMARDYHQRLQMKDLPEGDQVKEETADILSNITARISQREKNGLAKYITGEEVNEAINKLPNGKAAGMDGIAHELWKKLLKRQTDDVKAKRPYFNITEMLTKLFNDIEEHGVAAGTNFAEGWMCPIYKKGDKTDISNYRPITVLNTDYKIFTKILSIRLTEVAPGIIHADQAGFMRGRRIEDQTELMKLIIHKCDTQDERGAIVCLDQEKAYDKISHTFLWESLRKFDLPEHFIRSVQALYDSAETVVIINGVVSSPFRIVRGVRQGDPLSCLLFNIAIESLAQLLRKSELNGFQIKGRDEKLVASLFADDTTVYLSEGDKLEIVQAILSRWCRASGAKFNVPKTIIIPMGSKEHKAEVVSTRRLHPTHDPIPADIRIADEGEPIRALGAYIGNGVPEESIWTPTVEKVTKDLERWNRSHPTQDGKRLIVNMVVGGRTQYLTRVQGMPSTVENILTKRIREFMWNSSTPPPVAMSTLRLTHKEGGKKLLDVKLRNHAIELRKLGVFLCFGEGRPTWAKVADDLILANIRRGRGSPETSTLENPYLQATKVVLRAGNTTLPGSLVRMIKTGRQYGVCVLPSNPGRQAKRDMPAWHHIGIKDNKRINANTEPHRCLRAVHGIRTVGDVLDFTEEPESPDHDDNDECTCETCEGLRGRGCTAPRRCKKAARRMLDSLKDAWDPRGARAPAPQGQAGRDGTHTFDKWGAAEHDLRDCMRVFTAPGIAKEGRIPVEVNHEGTATISTDSRNVPDARGRKRIGWSATIRGPNGSATQGGRIPEEYRDLNTKAGKLLAMAAAINEVEDDVNLVLLCDTEEQLRSLTEKVEKHEEHGWIATANGPATRTVLEALRNRRGTVSLRVGKQNAPENREMAEDMARRTGTTEITGPPDRCLRGAKLQAMTQASLYRGIIEAHQEGPRRQTAINLDRIRCSVWEVTGALPDNEEIWKATRTQAFSKKHRAFLWRATHEGYKVGNYWNNKKDLERRGDCRKCGTTETMEHILLECGITHAPRLWQLAEGLWAKKSDRPWPNLNLGIVLGCGLIQMTDEKGKPTKGESRLYHTLVAETTHLIWRMRCWWKIEKKENDEFLPNNEEMENKWWAALDRRLKTDCLMTNNLRYGKKALDKDLVMTTWSNIVENEELLGDDWYRKYDGVLVGRGREHRKGRHR